MKLVYLKFLLLVSWQFMMQKTNYTDFLRFASSNFHVTQSLEHDLNCNYAVIRLTVDSRNVVTGYQIVNEASCDFNDSFKYLIGYKFSSKLAIHKRPVIFGLSINNRGEGSVFAYNGPTEAKIKEAFNRQHQKCPNAVYLDNLITINVEQSAE